MRNQKVQRKQMTNELRARKVIIYGKMYSLSLPTQIPIPFYLHNESIQRVFFFFTFFLSTFSFSVVCIAPRVDVTCLFSYDGMLEVKVTPNEM